MKRRIFIAIILPSLVQEHLKAIRDSIESQFEACPINWIDPKDLHLTMVFIGLADEAEIAKISQVVAEICARFKDFDLRLEYLNYGPENQMPPNFVWLTFAHNKTLSQIREALIRKLLDKGIMLKEKDFLPHITLGRVKQMEFRAIDPEDRPEISQSVDLKFPAQGLLIMESQLQRRKAVYKIVESHKFI